MQATGEQHRYRQEVVARRHVRPVQQIGGVGMTLAAQQECRKVAHEAGCIGILRLCAAKRRLGLDVAPRVRQADRIGGRERRMRQSESTRQQLEVRQGFIVTVLPEQISGEIGDKRKRGLTDAGERFAKVRFGLDQLAALFQRETQARDQLRMADAA